MKHMGRKIGKNVRAFCSFTLARVAAIGAALLPQIAAAIPPSPGFPGGSEVLTWPSGGIAGAEDIGEFLLWPCVAALYAFWILVVLTTILVIWAAYLYLVSGGDAEKVSKATKTLTWAAVAVAVALIARNFANIVATIFGVTYFGGTTFGC